METAVLLLTFNRPDTTAQVMQAIAQAKPRHLYVASDGPRPSRPDDEALVAETRRVVEAAITWPCTLHTLYNEGNLGLSKGVVSAIDWFFSHVSEGIILEDDCVAHPDFFNYCEELLDRYREDESVWAIGGDKPTTARLSGSASYSFIPYALVWGWATWKRAWDHYDREIPQWRSIRGTPAEKTLFPDRIERRIRSRQLDRILENPDYAWSYQWSFAMALSGGLATVPRENLISNIGWNRQDATHTKGSGRQRSNAPTASILPLEHPVVVAPDQRATRDILDGPVFGAGKHRLRSRVKKQVRKKLRALRAVAR